MDVCQRQIPLLFIKNHHITIKPVPRLMTLRRPADLPDFERPPVGEVVLSVQFASLAKFSNIYAGLLWEQFAERYPTVEEQMPLPPNFETFGLPPAPVPGPQMQLLTTPVTSRYWFISKDGSQLLQVQSDRLVHNWRCQSPDDNYPHYEPLRERFAAEVKQVQKFLIAKKLGTISPNQCEVTYINHIDLGEGIDPSDRLAEIFTVWTEQYSDTFLKRIERGQFNVSFILTDGSDAPYGRLHVGVQPAIRRATSAAVLQFTLTARGKPQKETIKSAFDWLDRGRIAVVRGFTSLTRPEMHQAWRRKNARR